MSAWHDILLFHLRDGASASNPPAPSPALPSFFLCDWAPVPGSRSRGDV